MTYSQQGQRCAAPVRSEDGQPICKGTEVIVTRYEKGIAYVRGFYPATLRGGETHPYFDCIFRLVGDLAGRYRHEYHEACRRSRRVRRRRRKIRVRPPLQCRHRHVEGLGEAHRRRMAESPDPAPVRGHAAPGHGTPPSGTRTGTTMRTASIFPCAATRLCSTAATSSTAAPAGRASRSRSSRSSWPCRRTAPSAWSAARCTAPRRVGVYIPLTAWKQGAIPLH